MLSLFTAEVSVSSQWSFSAVIWVGLLQFWVTWPCGERKLSL